MTRSRLLPLCLWIGLLCQVVVATADEPHFRRWAVLPAPEVAATGLSDLLMAELSQRKFDLVEREQLTAITKEIELSKLLSPEGSLQRLRVGQLTKADALVLLSLVEHGEGTMCSCGQKVVWAKGARNRLLLGELPSLAHLWAVDTSFSPVKISRFVNANKSRPIRVSDRLQQRPECFAAKSPPRPKGCSPPT